MGYHLFQKSQGKETQQLTVGHEETAREALACLHAHRGWSNQVRLQKSIGISISPVSQLVRSIDYISPSKSPTVPTNPTWVDLVSDTVASSVTSRGSPELNGVPRISIKSNIIGNPGRSHAFRKQPEVIHTLCTQAECS